MSTQNNRKVFLCISCCYKGDDFLRACKAAGNKVYLVTSEKSRTDPWPMDAIEEIFFMNEDQSANWNLEHLAAGLAHFMRTTKIDSIVALDDFDVEKAAYLREEFRIPGMGQTTARYFRDKLAMRMKAQYEGLKVPPFSNLFNNDDIHHFTQETPLPWIVKPRAEATAVGIKKVRSLEEFWNVVNELGDKRHHYLVEQFVAGDVYHVDALNQNMKVIFAQSSQYLNTPFEVAHGGGIFRSHTLSVNGKEDKALKAFNKKVMTTFGLECSASHTEFIKSKADGQFYFLETASRVGGAHIAEMVEYASGINLWKEWAILENAIVSGIKYTLPKSRNDYAGIVVSLSRFKQPDTTSFSEPEIAWRLEKEHHIGFIVRSPKKERILELLNQFAERIHHEFHASLPSA